MSWPEHFDWEPPDVPVDASVTYRCDDCDEEWHPELTGEWQGTAEMGAEVWFYEEWADECPQCEKPGREIDA